MECSPECRSGLRLRQAGRGEKKNNNTKEEAGAGPCSKPCRKAPARSSAAGLRWRFFVRHLPAFGDGLVGMRNTHFVLLVLFAFKEEVHAHTNP